MLGSIVRSLIFVALIGAAIWGVSALLRMEGGITVTVGETELYLTPIAGAVGILLAVVGIWFGVKLLGLLLAVLRFLTGDETALSRYFERGRMRRGLEALSRGMTAVAAGDAKEALQKAKKAERLLQRPELTRLLNAQAAELAGDQRRARIYWKALANDPDTAFVGVKGLLGQALAEGETEKALRLAEYGFAIKPRDNQLLETLYGLQSENFDWAGARKTLGVQKKVGLIGKSEAARREATLALAQAEDAEAANRAEEAKRRALEAAKLDPSNVEAVVAASKRLVAEGSKRSAARQITEAWRLNPDARLAQAFAEIEPDETPVKRRKRFQRLFDANPQHPETRFLQAELALFAEDWAGAREAIKALGEEDLSARSLAIMAAIARGQGEPDHVVRGWLARALGAPRDGAGDREMSHAAMLPLLIGEDEVEDIDVAPPERAGNRRGAAEDIAEPDVGSEPAEDAAGQPAEADRGAAAPEDGPGPGGAGSGGETEPGSGGSGTVRAAAGGPGNVSA